MRGLNDAPESRPRQEIRQLDRQVDHDTECENEHHFRGGQRGEVEGVGQDRAEEHHGFRVAQGQ